LTADQVSIVIVALVKIDITNLKVTGPEATVDRNIFKYKVSFCSDDNIDSVKSTDTFNSLLDQGNTGGLDVSEAPIASTPGTSDPNSASTLAVSTVALIAGFAALL